MNKKLQTIKYVLLDLISALVAWTLFYCYRKLYVEPLKFGYEIDLEFTDKFWQGLVFIPMVLLVLYALSGAYKNVYRKSRLREVQQTASQSIIGTLLIFFVVLLDDLVPNYSAYYYSALVLWGLLFFGALIGRIVLTSITKGKITRREIGFNTIFVGNNEKALKLYQEFEKKGNAIGFKFIGYVNGALNHEQYLSKYLPQIGQYHELENIVNQYKVEDVIIAIESGEHVHLQSILSELENTECDIKVAPDMYDIMSGMVKMNHLFGIPLIQIKTDLMPVWQQYTKRIMDISVSIIVLTIGFPVYVVVALGVMLSSRGPILFSQPRIGIHGLAFKIFKFRSMYVGSEKNGPQLASDNDNRITPFGKFIRKSRLDEIPQFYNVLIGDMSLVGPRPERQYFIDQIIKKSPHYKHLHKVRPGITSWGQVKYGYAENVDQMLERLKYDIIYIENMSLAIDLKILFYTILTVIQGRGK